MEMGWRFPIRRSPLICQKQKNVLLFAVTDYRLHMARRRG